MFLKLVEKETRKEVKIMRTSRGGEFLSKEFIKYCKDHGIRRQLMQSRTPQQNGVAVKRNITLIA